MTGPLRDLTALRADAELLRGTFRSSEAGMDRIEAYDRLWRDLPALIAAYERAEAAVQRVRDLHYPITFGTARHCNACSSFDGTRRVLWPCPTYRATQSEETR